MNPKGETSLYQNIVMHHYSNLYEYDLDKDTITEYKKEDLDTLREISFEEWKNEIAAFIPYMGIQTFFEQMDRNKILENLDQNGDYFIFHYQTKESDGMGDFQMTFYYRDSKKNHIVITKQETTNYMKSEKEKMSELQKDSERFRFIIKHLCENFGEINVKTGETWMTTCHNWEVEKGNLKDQIDWFADHLIVPEQKEAYRKDFELEHFVSMLRKNNGFYAPCYAAQYPDGIRYLLIINALLSNPVILEEEYIFGFVQDITNNIKHWGRDPSEKCFLGGNV